MPLDIRSQVVTALDNINRNPELYTPPKLTTPLETRINDLKETNPNKYREYISTLTSSANSGNEEARELLGKIGEDAARQRRGYEGLNTAMYAPAIIGAGVLAAPSISAAGKGVSWLYGQLPNWIKTGIDIGLTADGARNFFSRNGVQKTYREAKAGNYGKAILSGIGDTLDIAGAMHLPKSGRKTVDGIMNWGKTHKINLSLDPNKYYRLVSKSAIDDAISSGVVRANPKSYLSWDINKKYPKHWAGASFTKGRLYKPADKELRFVIEGGDNIEWIRKNAHDEIPNFNIDANRKLPINFGNEVTPIFDNKLNNAPLDFFQYWEKRNKWYDPFWHLKKFK